MTGSAFAILSRRGTLCIGWLRRINLQGGGGPEGEWYQTEARTPPWRIYVGASGGDQVDIRKYLKNNEKTMIFNFFLQRWGAHPRPKERAAVIILIAAARPT